MSGLGDKLKGRVQQVVGAAKEGVGKATGNPDLEESGMADKAKGNVTQVKGDVADAADQVGDTVGDAAAALRRKAD